MRFYLNCDILGHFGLLLGPVNGQKYSFSMGTALRYPSTTQNQMLKDFYQLQCFHKLLLQHHLNQRQETFKKSVNTWFCVVHRCLTAVFIEILYFGPFFGQKRVPMVLEYHDLVEIALIQYKDIVVVYRSCL